MDKVDCSCAALMCSAAHARRQGRKWTGQNEFITATITGKLEPLYAATAAAESQSASGSGSESGSDSESESGSGLRIRLRIRVHVGVRQTGTIIRGGGGSSSSVPYDMLTSYMSTFSAAVDRLDTRNTNSTTKIFHTTKYTAPLTRFINKLYYIRRTARRRRAVSQTLVNGCTTVGTSC